MPTAPRPSGTGRWRSSPPADQAGPWGKSDPPPLRHPTRRSPSRRSASSTTTRRSICRSPGCPMATKSSSPSTSGPHSTGHGSSPPNSSMSESRPAGTGSPSATTGLSPGRVPRRPLRQRGLRRHDHLTRRRPDLLTTCPLVSSDGGRDDGGPWRRRACSTAAGVALGPCSADGLTSACPDLDDLTRDQLDLHRRTVEIGPTQLRLEHLRVRLGQWSCHPHHRRVALGRQRARRPTRPRRPTRLVTDSTWDSIVQVRLTAADVSAVVPR